MVVYRSPFCPHFTSHGSKACGMSLLISKLTLASIFGMSVPSRWVHFFRSSALAIFSVETGSLRAENVVGIVTRLSCLRPETSRLTTELLTGLSSCFIVIRYRFVFLGTAPSCLISAERGVRTSV